MATAPSTMCSIVTNESALSCATNAAMHRARARHDAPRGASPQRRPTDIARHRHAIARHLRDARRAGAR